VMSIAKTASELAYIASHGGSIIVPEENSYTASELAYVASNAKDEARLMVRGTKKFTASELAYIASQAPGRVTFEE